MRPRVTGFTLIELMVALAVLAILAALAIPSFADLRQRATLRGAADQLTVFWGNARMEALRRNSMVKVGFRTAAGGDFCVGAATTTDGNDDAACDCSQPVSTAVGRCDVAVYPAAQADWRGVRIPSLPTLGESDADNDGVAVIDPKRGILTDRADAGRMRLRAPNGGADYRLDVFIDGNGRPIQCEPSTAPSKLPDYGTRQC